MDNGESAGLYLQNPFYRFQGDSNNQKQMMAEDTNNDVIEFVSPRPNEEEDKIEEDYPGSNIIQIGGVMIPQNNTLGYYQFTEI